MAVSRVNPRERASSARAQTAKRPMPVPWASAATLTRQTQLRSSSCSASGSKLPRIKPTTVSPSSTTRGQVVAGLM